jgi:hypothetical protein
MGGGKLEVPAGGNPERRAGGGAVAGRDVAGGGGSGAPARPSKVALGAARAFAGPPA